MTVCYTPNVLGEAMIGEASTARRAVPTAREVGLPLALIDEGAIGSEAKKTRHTGHLEIAE